MKIRKLMVKGFRCLANFEVEFESDVTVIVGENDAGKSSLIECLKVVTENKTVEADDFNYETNEMSIEVHVDDFIFEGSYIREGNRVAGGGINARPTREYVALLAEKLDKSDIDFSDEGVAEFIRKTAKTFGIQVRSNSRLEGLRDSILERLNQAEGGADVVITNSNFPEFNNIQLNGIQFENVAGFFKEVFLKEKQAEIWREKVDGDKSIEDFVKSKVDEYSEDVARKLEQKGILEKIQVFLRDLTEIRIEPIYQTKDLNIDAKVKFLEGGREISIDKKGDGTKRRISMALLEFKKEEALLQHDTSTIYLLDEPDTHLHVKAQLELLETLQKFAEAENQVIITTHSPFIINASHPRQIRLVENKENRSSVRFLRGQSDISDRLLRSMGIENTYLFFSRNIVIVEGETEEEFLPAWYMRLKERPLSSSLTKIVNAKGINNIPGFAKALLEVHDQERIFLLYDNDGSPDLRELMERLGVPDERRFVVGNKEFEDAFSGEAIFRSWSSYQVSAGRAVPPGWTREGVDELAARCNANGGKLSEELRALNAGGKKMTKPLLGRALAENVREDELPLKLRELIAALS